jgi:hypothetical protein
VPGELYWVVTQHFIDDRESLEKELEMFELRLGNATTVYVAFTYILSRHDSNQFELSSLTSVRYSKLLNKITHKNRAENNKVDNKVDSKAIDDRDTNKGTMISEDAWSERAYSKVADSEIADSESVDSMVSESEVVVYHPYTAPATQEFGWELQMGRGIHNDLQSSRALPHPALIAAQRRLFSYTQQFLSIIGLREMDILDGHQRIRCINVSSAFDRFMLKRCLSSVPLHSAMDYFS